MATKMGNLTCVLTEMELLTPDLKINIDGYMKLAEGYMDCYRISENWPQAPLNKNPLKKIFGRHMIFFKCAHKNEVRNCAKAEMLEWLETVYGTDPEYDPAEHGLPKDKYDAAAVSIMVL